MSHRTVALALLLLAAFAIVFLAANATFTWIVEHRTETSLENRLGSPVDVNLSGFPVTPRLLNGSIPRAEVTVEEIGLARTRMSLGRLNVTLTNVRYKGERDGPLAPPIQAQGAYFELRMSERQVSELAGGLPGVQGAELTSDGLLLELPGGATADAELVAEEGGLALKPETPLLAPELPLIPGRLPGGASVQEVRVGEEEVVIRGQMDDLGV